MKTILDSYYTHEAILDRSIYSTDKKELTFYLKFCEWQLEELAEKGDNAKGITIKFLGVENVSNKKFLKIKDEFILEFYIYKNKSFIMLDNEESSNVEFNYKKFEYVLI